jgi:hypothetical protein
MSDKLNTKRVKYTRQSIISNTFFQMPRFLAAGEFAGNKITNNARFLYTLLLDRHRISIKNNWFDGNGEVYIYFKREEMETQLGLSERTVSKVIQELKDFFLVEEKQQGLNKPNKIYMLSPIIGNDENPAPYLDPNNDYDPEKADDYGYSDDTVISTPPDPQDLRIPTRNNYASRPVENAPAIPVNSTVLDPQELRPNDNKANNNKKKNNNMSDNELIKTATADRGEADDEPPLAAEAAAENQQNANQSIPYSQILDKYNELCETTGLRSIRSINGKRKTQTAARFKEYGLSGFFDLFDKVASSGFLCGGGNRGWKADYDWLTAPSNMQNVLEGKYDDNQSNTPMQQQYYEPCQTQGFSNPPQNKNERRDPFLERALTAYETAKRATG